MGYILGIMVIVLASTLTLQGDFFNRLLGRVSLKNPITENISTDLPGPNAVDDYYKIDKIFERSAKEFLESDVLTEDQKTAILKAQSAFKKAKGVVGELEEYKDTAESVKSFLQEFIVKPPDSAPASSSE